MVYEVFFDTWAWLTLRDKRESMHYKATETYKNLNKSGCTIITSDYVLDEFTEKCLYMLGT